MANLRVNKITGTEVFETTGSVQFDGNGDYLTISPNSDFSVRTGDFTIEFWMYRTDTGNNVGLLDTRSSNIDTNGWFIRFNSSTTIQLVDNANEYITATHTSNWNHIAFVRKSNILTAYINGTLTGSPVVVSKDFTSSNFLMGGFVDAQSSPNAFGGHISNLRILKGTALYTKNFTPPTRELTVIPNTVLLACTSSTRANEEKTGKTITVNGNAVANELTPGLLTDRVKSGGTSAIAGSVEFNGTGDWLEIPSSSSFNFESSNLTIEAWIYPTVSGIKQIVAKNSGTYPAGFEWNFGFDVSDNLLFNGYGSSGYFAIIATTKISLNAWTHLAVVKNNTTLTLFVNGVLNNSTSVISNPFQITSSPVTIGRDLESSGGGRYFKGFISNLRIVKGTALYTSNFTPPTRELKKIPNTVLLCCKDSSNPTAEETGKTITSYGSLVYNPPELVVDGEFNSASSWPSAGADWSISGGKATINSANSGYDFLGILTNRTTNGLLYELRFDITNWTAGRLELSQSDSSNVGVTVSGNGSYTFRFRYTGTTNGNIGLYSYTDTTASFALDNLSLKQVASVPSPPFTPSVGFDGTVTFDGVTKINTPNYFYLPTGNTEDRDTNPGVRGVFSAGYQAPATPSATNVTDYINISSTGNAQYFGDSTSPRWGVTSCSSSTRGLIGGGTNPGPGRLNIIDYITIASTGNAQDFGDLTDARRALGSCSSSTRGIFAGGYLTSPEVPATVLYNIIDYVTISTTGNAQDFGDTTFGGGYKSGFSSPTRGIIGGNYLYGGTPNQNNVIDYITIASTGNAQDFGDLTQNKTSMGACSNSVRGLFGGGFTPGIISAIDYVTIASTGNAIRFGDLIESKLTVAGTSSQIRGIFGGGSPSTNVIQYVSIMSTGNTTDFGDLTVARGYFDACSNGHGGLS